ncbi:kinase-like protein [Emericellopsis cladophorae]|uniref:Kinase-like protein n=1 Tax=Emericellopsis cladophorae TaxID=2686198 RepID=A0A9P9XZ60_9HYPO|nr:kinase-like protein [Emericellopsis cladophorae]KAI6780598.1 kinase-like protein [Emericellopsis cladophorae]
MDRRPGLQALWVQMENNRVAALGGRSFVPPSSLPTIFTRAAVAAAVRELACSTEDRIGLTDDILRDGVLTFAMLISIRQPDHVVAFRRMRCLNRRPLDEENARKLLGDHAPSFLREQWVFQPYYFRRGHDVEIAPLEILPFIRSVDSQTSGGFGDIDKLEIHPALQDFYPSATGGVLVVRKTLRRVATVSEERRMAMYQNEKRCLRLINHPPHPHIVPLLSAYVYEGNCCMLFPLLEMDLKAFLERPTPYGRFRWSFTYFSALCGLASALAQVHNVQVSLEGDHVDLEGIGYHHDLRPANILVNAHSFLLADFGMGRIRVADDGSETPFKALSGDYVAPECMDERSFAGLGVGRAVDVWAFGCLVLEVMVYSYLGTSGLTRFRQERLTPGPSGFITDTFFHDGRGNIKQVVKEWIDVVAAQGHSTVGVLLQRLALSTLKPVQERPTSSMVCRCLSRINLDAHFSAAYDILAATVDEEARTDDRGSLMKMWFERERLHAFGVVLGLLTEATELAIPKFAELHGEKCVQILLEIFQKLSRPPGSGEHVETSSRLELGVAEETMDQLTVEPGDNGETLLEDEIQRLVQDLWFLLSSMESRKAERLWIHSMLDATSCVEKLDRMGQVLRSRRPAAYQQSAAMVTMKKIRLQMVNELTQEGDLGRLELQGDDIPQVDDQAALGHLMGVDRHGERVFVEVVHYDPSWDRIPPAERTVVMAQKAMGFNAKPKPSNLRVLDCVGFFENGNSSGSAGFSFVYQFPESIRTPDSTPSQGQRALMTLHQLLLLSAKKMRTDQHSTQPLLGDKFRLASLLAGFLGEFHGIGWLHENLHSNNVVFFEYEKDVENHGISAATSSTLCQPFVVGLDKVRPGGESWHTQGPAEHTDFPDYRHPDYQHTERFRVGYDYYSLGIMLLEIGLWTPLVAIAGRNQFSTLSPHKLRAMLVDRYLPRLGYRMGFTYQAVVDRLLSDKLDPEPRRQVPDAVAESKAFSAFMKQVIDPLEQLANGSI